MTVRVYGLGSGVQGVGFGVYHYPLSPGMRVSLKTLSFVEGYDIAFS